MYVLSSLLFVPIIEKITNKKCFIIPGSLGFNTLRIHNESHILTTISKI